MCKNKAELNELVEKYRKLSAKKKKVEDELEAVKDDITEYVVNKGEKGGKNGTTLIVFGDGYKVSLITINKPIFDSEKLAALLGDKLPEYKKPNIYPKLDIR